MDAQCLLYFAAPEKPYYDEVEMLWKLEKHVDSCGRQPANIDIAGAFIDVYLVCWEGSKAEKLLNQVVEMERNAFGKATLRTMGDLVRAYEQQEGRLDASQTRYRKVVGSRQFPSSQPGPSGLRPSPRAGKIIRLSFKQPILILSGSSLHSTSQNRTDL